MSRLGKKRIGWVFVAGILVVGLWSLFLIKRDPYAERFFEQATWKANSVELVSETTDNPRGKMVRDLMSHHLTTGMVLESVIDLLGTPDNVGLPKDSRGTISYHVGAYSGGPLIQGADFLVLEFDEKGDLSIMRLVQSD